VPLYASGTVPATVFVLASMSESPEGSIVRHIHGAAVWADGDANGAVRDRDRGDDVMREGSARAEAVLSECVNSYPATGAEDVSCPHVTRARGVLMGVVACVSTTCALCD
jgi:hypothetical protein